MPQYLKGQTGWAILLAAALVIAASGLAAVSADDDQPRPPKRKAVIRVVLKEQPIDPPASSPQPPNPTGLSPQPQPNPQSNPQPQPMPPLLQPVIRPDNPWLGQPGTPADRPSGLAGTVLTNKVGAERVQQILEQIRPGPGHGAPNADIYFDRQHVLNGDGLITPKEQTQFFQGSSNRRTNLPPSTPVPAYRDSNPPTTAAYSRELAEHLGSVPGGVVLDGTADLEPFEKVTYDARFNAFVLDNRAVYFLQISPRTTIELCEALAQDVRIGVSIGQVFISYGALSKDSEVAQDLMMTDHFLGDIAFGLKQWTRDYSFANGYQPQPYDYSMSAAVFFRFSDFQFGQDEQQELYLAGANFEDRFIPLSNQRAADGGGLPDETNAGQVAQGTSMNLQHLSENMAYYRQEKLIQQTYAYGEVAAFLRGLKQRGVDLAELARAIQSVR
jgi:hypothetical protein